MLVSLVVLAKGTPEADLGGAKYFVSTDLNLNGAFFTQLRGQ